MTLPSRARTGPVSLHAILRDDVLTVAGRGSNLEAVDPLIGVGQLGAGLDVERWGSHLLDLEMFEGDLQHFVVRASVEHAADQRVDA
jgi:hypothetical protein